MLETNRYLVINIRRYLNSDNPKLGESRLLQVLSGFSCLRNPEKLIRRIFLSASFMKSRLTKGSFKKRCG